MKRVYLLRHGKTESESESGKDFDRRLTSEGKQDVYAVADKLVDTEERLDLLLTSSAARAASSAAIMAEKLLPNAETVEREDLYEAEKENLLSILQSLDSTAETAMIVGHNPTIEDTMEAFLDKHRKIGAGNIAWFEFEGDSWNELTFETPIQRSGLIVPV